MKRICIYILLGGALLAPSLFSAQNEVCLEIGKNPFGSESGLNVFSKYVNIHGTHLFAEESMADEKLLHAAAIQAELLDNDENGIADHDIIINSLTERNASIILLSEDSDIDAEWFSDNFSLNWEHVFLMENDIQPEGSSELLGFDESIHASLVLIHRAGYAELFPEIWGLELGSEVSLAMNDARGGYYPFVPEEYPEGAWYTESDADIDYFDLIPEYVYWAISSALGAQEATWRCDVISDTWTLCTPDDFLSDASMNALLESEAFPWAESMPDGTYCPTGDFIRENKAQQISFSINIETRRLILSEQIQAGKILSMDGRIQYQWADCLSELDLFRLDAGVYIFVDLERNLSSSFLLP